MEERVSERKRVWTGFSLVEVMTAVVLLAMIGGGMLAIFGQGFITAKKVQNQAIAYSLGRESLEKYSDWASLPPNGTYNDPPGSLFSNFTRQVAVSDGPIFPAELKQVTVTVSWGSRTQSFSTLVADF